MTNHQWLLAVIVVGACLGAIGLFQLGTKFGRRWGRQEIINEFQYIIGRAVTLAAGEKYKELHLFLHDLVEDYDVTGGDIEIKSSNGNFNK